MGVLVLPEVGSEDWIPQAADFVSQIEGVQVAAAAGVVDGNIVISGRNWESDLNCGEIFKENFDKLGSAGGHKSMAKAVIPEDNWLDHFGAKSLTATKAKLLIQKIIVKGVAKQSA
ncbi:MAG: DHHA1 domain-containing protein [Bdellovibrionota bacterium]